MITHPEKVLFPESGITKGDLAAYYEAIAPLMLPHIRRRPITMERFPAGIAAQGFLQKDVIKGFPEWLKRIEAPKKDGIVHYPMANDVRSLLWLANQNTIAIHVWPSRAPRLDNPDLCVIDLDPSRDEPDILRKTVLGARDAFDELGHVSWVKTSGSKGFHIVARLKGRATFASSHALAERVASLLLRRYPQDMTLAFSKADRGGKILIDTARNRMGATFAAPYSVRAKADAPVSAPCTWTEVERGLVGAQTFTLQTMGARVKKVGDLWADLVKTTR